MYIHRYRSVDRKIDKHITHKRYIIMGMKIDDKMFVVISIIS